MGEGGTTKKVATAAALDLASTFLDLVPRYDHIVTARMYNSLRARRQLLEHLRRHMLPDKLSQLGLFADNSKDFLHDYFGVEQYPIEYDSAMSALEVGQKTVVILAAVNIIEDFASNTRGPDMARTMLRSASASSLPEVLRQSLEQIVGP